MWWKFKKELEFIAMSTIEIIKIDEYTHEDAIVTFIIKNTL